MKKKVFATLLAVAMVASMVPASVAVQAAEGDTIRLVNGKVEVDAQFKKLAEMWPEAVPYLPEVERREATSTALAIPVETLNALCGIPKNE